MSEVREVVLIPSDLYAQLNELGHTLIKLSHRLQNESRRITACSHHGCNVVFIANSGINKWCREHRQLMKKEQDREALKRFRVRQKQMKVKAT